MGIKATFCTGFALAAAVALTGPAFAQDTTADTVVATVNGTDITLGHMIVLRNGLPPQYQALPDEALFKGILEQLVQQTALEQSLAGRLTKTDTLTIENSRRGYLSGVALQAVVAGAVNDGALQAAYDTKYAKAEPTKEYNAAHILVKTLEEAQAIKAELDAGGDFAELAKKNSSDGSAAGGGDLGWFGLGMMVKPFEDGVLALEVGGISDPVESQFGWHLIQLKETRNAAAPSLDEVRADLAAEIEQTAVEAHLATLTAAATITRPGEALDPALLRDLSLLDK